MGLGGHPRTQANETTFETSRTGRPLPAAWASSCGSHGSGTRIRSCSELSGGVDVWWPRRAEIQQCPADVDDVDHPYQASIAHDRQMPEALAGHGLGRVADAGHRADDGRASGHQLADLDIIPVLVICDRAGAVVLGENAGRVVGLLA